MRAALRGRNFSSPLAALKSSLGMSFMDLTKEDLEKLLREAEEAHGEYEQKLGHRDDNWPSWYAEFIVKKLQEREKRK